jgi:hypothetical protein
MTPLRSLKEAYRRLSSSERDDFKTFMTEEDRLPPRSDERRTSAIVVKLREGIGRKAAYNGRTASLGRARCGWSTVTLTPANDCEDLSPQISWRSGWWDFVPLPVTTQPSARISRLREFAANAVAVRTVVAFLPLAARPKCLAVCKLFQERFQLLWERLVTPWEAGKFDASILGSMLLQAAGRVNVLDVGFGAGVPKDQAGTSQFPVDVDRPSSKPSPLSEAFASLAQTPGSWARLHTLHIRENNCKWISQKQLATIVGKCSNLQRLSFPRWRTDGFGAQMSLSASDICLKDICAPSLIDFQTSAVLSNNLIDDIWKRCPALETLGVGFRDPELHLKSPLKTLKIKVVPYIHSDLMFDIGSVQHFYFSVHKFGNCLRLKAPLLQTLHISIRANYSEVGADALWPCLLTCTELAYLRVNVESGYGGGELRKLAACQLLQLPNMWFLDISVEDVPHTAPWETLEIVPKDTWKSVSVAYVNPSAARFNAQHANQLRDNEHAKLPVFCTEGGQHGRY